MKTEEFKTFEYDCKDVHELLFLYAVWPEETTIDERDETAKHLLKCPKCRNDYLKLKQVAPAICDNPQLLAITHFAFFKSVNLGKLGLKAI